MSIEEEVKKNIALKWREVEQIIKDGRLPICDDCKKQMEIGFENGRPVNSNFGWIIRLEDDEIEHTKCPICASKFIKKHLNYNENNVGFIDDVIDQERLKKTTTLSDLGEWKVDIEDIKSAIKKIRKRPKIFFNHIDIVIPKGQSENEEVIKIKNASHNAYLTYGIIESDFLINVMIVKLMNGIELIKQFIFPLSDEK